ncbi:AcaB family transcriptional regulator [Aromatoleum anaerobium]|uniref:DUF1845 domain-containing protein n=1 Tax=Aromatoleum anaerobium TaxID=182180 RepID=A0ABX1PMJ3_9RHOO|nr:AcaB family transcriptional regulator [Aromatoleum anaerobium]MCK0508195.1 AcaB family transcriptional regulator [Aromatoleum anaerobium]
MTLKPVSLQGKCGVAGEELQFNPGLMAAFKAEYRVTAGADATVEPAVATQLRDLGSLVDDGVDTMTLHTKEGFRMFMGRRRDPAGHYNDAIPGGKRVASSLKALWALTRNNNPYADWALLRADHRIPELRRALDRQAQLFSAELKKRADKGLSFGILKSREPKVLELGFRSPYGYVIAELIVEFDYYVRVVKTLGRKALPDLLALSRADFLPGADANAQKRAAAVTGIFGAVPAGIYAGHQISRHSQRRISISDTEKAMLERVAADIAAIESERGGAGVTRCRVSLTSKESIMPNVFRGKGNLADTPILKHVAVNGADEVVAEMRVFFDDYAYDQANDEYQQVGGFWMSVSLWGQRGEDAARLLRRGARVQVEGVLKQFLYLPDGASDKVPGFQVTADDVTLCLGRVAGVEYKPKRELAESHTSGHYRF